jgi:hypothetical protein
MFDTQARGNIRFFLRIVWRAIGSIQEIVRPEPAKW